MAKKLTIEQWVAKVNKLAHRMDEIASAIHPSAHHESELPKLTEQYKALARDGAEIRPMQEKGERNERRTETTC